MMSVPVSIVLLLALFGTAPMQTRSPDLATELDGAWNREGKGPEILRFFGDRCVSSFEAQQTLFAVEYHRDRLVRMPVRGGPVLTEKVLLGGDRLTLIYSSGIEVEYSRLPEIPESVRIEPLQLGTRETQEDERTSIRQELRQRTVRDQAIRSRMSDVLGRAKTPQARQRLMHSDDMLAIGESMSEIDADNTKWLVETLQDVGWIDADEWGNQANQDAFLIVQHSGNLRLMRSALPLFEQEAQDNPAIRQSFALLYDRTQQNLGKEQRYGSQLEPAPHGGLWITRLEDPDRVDEWRASLGMEPIQKYMDRFRNSSQMVTLDRSWRYQTPSVRYEFRNSFWINLHHAIWAYAFARTEDPQSEHWAVEIPEDDVAVWDDAVEFYQEEFEGRSLLFGTEFVAMDAILSDAGDAEELPEAMRERWPLLSDILTDVEWAYREFAWDEHYAANKDFLAKLRPLIEEYGTRYAVRLPDVYQSRWPDSAIVVDLLSYSIWAGAYTNVSPPHIRIGTEPQPLGPIESLETFWHESSHVLVGNHSGVMNQINQAAEKHKWDPADLWHAILFVTDGQIIKELGAVEDSHQSFADRYGLFPRSPAWQRFRAALFEHWLPYLRREVSLEESVTRIVQTLSSH